MKPALQALLGRRSFFKKAGIAAAGASALGFATQDDAEAALGRVNTSSRPSDLRITDLRVAQLVDAPMRVPLIRIDTNQGITGWGEMLKNDAKACAAGALEVADYLVGRDPRPVTHHWQAIHRGAFYRGGPIKTAISSGIDMALWDIAGKCYGVPVYKLLGGPTRDRVRVYGTVSEETGVNAMKVGPSSSRQALPSSSPMRTHLPSTSCSPRRR